MFYKRLDDYYGVILYRYCTHNWFCMSLDLVNHIYLTNILIRTIIDIDNFVAVAIGLMLDYSI